MMGSTVGHESETFGGTNYRRYSLKTTYIDIHRVVRAHPALYTLRICSEVGRSIPRASWSLFFPFPFETSTLRSVHTALISPCTKRAFGPGTAVYSYMDVTNQVFREREKKRHSPYLHISLPTCMYVLYLMLYIWRQATHVQFPSVILTHYNYILRRSKCAQSTITP